MTEKRFQIDDDGDITEFENQQWIDTFEYGNGKDWNNLCKRLNELFDENKQLKLENGEMKDYLGRLEEENEQLKKEIKEYRRYTGMSIDDMKDVVKYLKNIKGDDDD